MTGASASDIISSYLQLLRRAPQAPPSITALPLSSALLTPDASRPCALIFSPHPDDECLLGAMPLRLKREQNWRIINIALTLGSNTERRGARKVELAKACAVLGFDSILSDADGFSGVNEITRKENPAAWQIMTVRLGEIIAHYKPQAIFLPHAHDLHPAHIGTHLLGLDALAKQVSAFTCAVLECEYWHPLEEPNLMIGIAENEASALLSALSCHAGENARNPFDARFPSYLIDNVRRGSERIGGKGVPAAPMDFAMIYKFGLWKNGKILPSALERIIGTDESVSELF